MYREGLLFVWRGIITSKLLQNLYTVTLSGLMHRRMKKLTSPTSLHRLALSGLVADQMDRMMFRKIRDLNDSAAAFVGCALFVESLRPDSLKSRLPEIPNCSPSDSFLALIRTPSPTSQTS